jgi:hypothetical protein
MRDPWVDLGYGCFVRRGEIAYVHDGNPEKLPLAVSFTDAGHKPKASVYLRNGLVMPCYITATRLRDTLLRDERADAERRARERGYQAGYHAAARRYTPKSPDATRHSATEATEGIADSLPQERADGD